MRIKGLLFLGFVMALGLFIGNNLQAAMPTPLKGISLPSIAGGGGDDKEKKEKKSKGDKRDKDKSMKDAKTSNASSKPSQHARNSAKEAKYSSKMAQKQIMGRAKVRNFFHNMFNTKYGKPVNFRNKYRRNRWSRGR